jgi:hypothetical protein
MKWNKKKYNNNRNKRMSCPIKMADGRYFTNYEPRCIRNANLNELLTKNNITNSSYEQRLFLQQNSQMIIDMEKKKALEAIFPCIPCNAGELINETNKQMDNQYYVNCDGVSCSRKLVNPNGLGTTKNF